MSASALKREIAEVFERAAADTGDAAWHRAALALLPKKKNSGRPPTDDSIALAAALRLLGNGTARNSEHAVTLVCAALECDPYGEATHKRLARKLRRAIKLRTK
jgi:hypothetical protein